MKSVTDPTVFEWWSQIVIPSVGAVAALAAAVVAVVALVISRSARSGVENIREGLNRDSVPVEVTSTAGLRSTAPTATDEQASWEMTEHGNVLRFRNTTGIDVAIEKVEGTGNHPLTLNFDLPAMIARGASFDVRYHRVLGGSAVVGVTLTWTIPEGIQLTQTFYV